MINHQIDYDRTMNENKIIIDNVIGEGQGQKIMFIFFERSQ